MNKKKGFLIYPVSFYKDIYFKVLVNDIRSKDIELNHFIPGLSYNENSLKNSDIVFLYLPDNSWSFSLNMLSSFMKEEILKAIDLNIPIILCYKRHGYGNFNFYSTKVSDVDIEGRIKIDKFYFKESFPLPSPENVRKGIDYTNSPKEERRLLLLIT